MNLKLLKAIFPTVSGVLFGLISVALAYLVFTFCFQLISSAGFSWLVKKAEEAKVFDFAIFIALLTFVGKEYLDSRFSKKAERARKANYGV